MFDFNKTWKKMLLAAVLAAIAVLTEKLTALPQLVWVPLALVALTFIKDVISHWLVPVVEAIAAKK
jgi:hypothetical protein